MADGEVPEKVRTANKVRWKESVKMAIVERKLTKRLKEDLGQRHFLLELSLHLNLSERTAMERGWECDQCKTHDCGKCRNCQGEGQRAMRAQSRGIGANIQNPYEEEQRRCVNWLENPPLPPSSTFSGDTSSTISKTTKENLASGLE